MKIRKSHINSVFLILLLCWALLPVASHYLGAFGYIVFFVMWLLTTNKRILFMSIKKGTLFIVWYGILLILLIIGIFSYGRVDNTYFFNMTAFSIMPFFIGTYYAILDNNNDIERIKKIVLFLSIITFVTTIIVTLSYPDAPKTLAMGTEMDKYKEMYVKMNCGGYGFVYGFIISFIPILASRFKERFWNVIKGIYIVLGCIVLVVSQYTIGLIVFSIGLILYFLFTPNKSRFAVILKMLLVIAGLLFVLYLPAILESLANALNSYSTLSVRLSDLAMYIRYGSIGNSVNSRFVVYGISWDSFLRHPILGGLIQGDNTIGAHSTILDLLALIGIVGMLPLFLFFVRIARSARNKYYTIALVSYLLLSILNPTIYVISIGFALYLTALIFVNIGEES